MEKRKSIVLILTAILLMAIMAGIWLLLFPSRPAHADEEIKQAVEMELEEKEEETETGKYVPNPDSEIKASLEEKVLTEKEKLELKLANVKGISVIKLLPHYHIIGKYQDYDVEIRAYSMSDNGPYYEYCDMFDYFFNRNDVVWNNGDEPRTCSEYRLAVFDCIDCGEMVVFGLSGVHTLGESEIINGYEIKHCSVCDKDISVDFYKHINLPDNDYLTADVYFAKDTTVSVQNLPGLSSIYWGIGSTDTNTVSVSDNGVGSYSHTYNTKGRGYVYFMGCTEIGDRAFLNCTVVREITVPNTISSVGHNAFSGCSELERICFMSDTPCEIESDSFSGCSAPIYVLDDYVSDYKAAWTDYSDRIFGLSEQEFEEPTNSGSSGTGAGGGSSESFLSSVGLDGFSLDGLTDDTDVLGKIIAGVMLFVLVGVFFMIPSFKSKKRK